MKKKTNKPKQFRYVFRKNASLPTVAVITTGGTIAEKIDIKTGLVVPAVPGIELLKSLPELTKVANIKLLEFCNIDSSQMLPYTWYALSEIVRETIEDPEIGGVVITHGTDTIAETAYFLDITIDSEKPIVFTGALRNASSLSPDGPANLYNAVVQAAAGYRYNWGVTVTLNQYINSARETRKIEANNLHAFDSGVKGYLGYIAKEQIIFFHDRTRRLHLPLPKKLADVILLKTYTGDHGDLIRFAVDAGVQGIVVEGFGVGNVHALVYDAIRYALSHGVIVVVATSVDKGGVYPIYGIKGGGGSLQKLGAILSGDLSAPKARVLLMIALAKVGGDRDKLNHYFSREYD